MPGRPMTPSARAEAARARMPHVPEFAARRVADAYARGEPPPSGTTGALDAFFAALAASGLPPERADEAAFSAVATSRTRLRTLLAALERFAPEVPLAAAAPARQRWDAWLNRTYNAKAPRPRPCRRVGPPPEDWPAAWRDLSGRLEQPIRAGGARFRRLRPRSAEAVRSAMGLLLAARDWAGARGVERFAAPCPDWIDAFVRFLLLEREVSPRSAADYLERVRQFLLRTGTLDRLIQDELTSAVGALRDMAADSAPSKHRRLRELRRHSDIVAIISRAAALGEAAREMPGCSAGRARTSRKAVVLALLVNRADRQGDVRLIRIGREAVRRPDGIWEIELRQAKTGVRKDMGPLWPVTCALLDAHVLSDRPPWTIGERLAELDGCNLLSLEDREYGNGHVSALLTEEFDIPAHLVRTLVCDTLRIHRPDAAWAAQALLGHASERMQTVYRADFAETSAVHALAECVASFE